MDDKIIPDFHEDEGVDLDTLNSHINDDIYRKKNVMASEIMDKGQEYIDEIDRKNKKRNLIKKKYIPYVLKHCDEYTEKELYEYSYKDVIEIYNEVKVENRPLFLKIIHYIFFNK